MAEVILHENRGWLEHAANAIEEAKGATIWVASPWFDNEEIVEALMRALRKRQVVNVMVDKKELGREKCRDMSRKLQEIIREGAEVRQVSGFDLAGMYGSAFKGEKGIMHVKAVVVGTRWFVGSHNCTRAAAYNREVMVEIRGNSEAKQQFLGYLCKLWAVGEVVARVAKESSPSGSAKGHHHRHGRNKQSVTGGANGGKP